ncbi:hypothetical protein ILUMI_03709 [Ignelater luminosus]|uniref:Uncharacterized protein n=1 Tax=Ignelater luminosus TaxID=2038154 RepID=A0A8K0GK77_IGNLU|nr:hypothetical protein ILUMI_03709 [Ignelater luminosus]
MLKANSDHPTDSKQSEVLDDIENDDPKNCLLESDAKSEHSDHPTDSKQSEVLDDIENDDPKNCLLVTKQRPLNSGVFGFSKNETKVKPNKVVLVLFTLHHYDKVDKDTRDKAKPEMLTFLSKEVDLIDEINVLYSVARVSLPSSIQNLPCEIKISARRIAGAEEEPILKKRLFEELCAFCA